MSDTFTPKLNGEEKMGKLNLRTKSARTLLSKLSLLGFIICLFGMSYSDAFAFTRTQHSSWTGLVGLYGTVIQTDSTTDCSGDGLLSCPGKESWQKLTDVTTSDGKRIDWLTLDADVKQDMLDDGVPTDCPDTTYGDYIYTGTVHANYINETTNERVFRSAVWRANCMNVFTYTTYVVVIPNE